jgi:dGTPase
MMNWKQLLSANRSSQPDVQMGAARSPFEQDYDRIIFSYPFRRLQDKTQVHPLPEHDFVHTRLTHSLEVSSVGRSLGKSVGEVLTQRHALGSFSLYDFGAIVAAASLAHDLGNPPFGHAGEDALSEFFLHHPNGKPLQQEVTAQQWHDLTHFEGNAQGFRILNNKQYGLKLTPATLGAFTKYPCPSLFPQRNKLRKSQKKFGFFLSEKSAFSQVAATLGLLNVEEDVWCRHPLAFLVEAADDICYSIIDLEDACRLKLVSFDETVALLAPILKGRLDIERLKHYGLNEKLGLLRALTINQLVEACVTLFLYYEDALLAGKFDSALTDLSDYKSALDEISRVSVERIYRAKHVVEIEATGHEVLPGLLAEFLQTSIRMRSERPGRKYQNLSLLLPPEVLTSIQAQTDFYTVTRLVLDFVSGLTDRHALSLFRKIKGISL